MNPQKQDSAYISLAIPYEDAGYRPFTDASMDEHRYTGTVTADGLGWNVTDSANCYVTAGGWLRQRPPFVKQANTILSGKTIVRMWMYDTLPDSNGDHYTYLLMSVRNNTSGLYEMYYWYTGGALSFTQFTSVRDVNASVQPHHVVFARGLAYVMSFPLGASSEKQGTIIFDGSTGTPTYRLWGIPGPTTPFRLVGWRGKLGTDEDAASTTFRVESIYTTAPTAPFVLNIVYEQVNVTAVTPVSSGIWDFTVTRGYNGTTAADYYAGEFLVNYDWSPSSHIVDVNIGWQYSYSYVSATGQVSNRADVERNIDVYQSNTGPFYDMMPEGIVQGDADTTNIPSIDIWRTQDGGENFLYLERIANTGAGDITYVDDSFESGASGSVTEDPVPDQRLDTNRIAPSLLSNSPPPRVNPPLVSGTDTPSRATSKIVYFQRRFWYAIDNVIYYSSDEELTEGIPEESFKAGTSGNAIKVDSAVVTIEATRRALYVMTAGGSVYIVYGNSAETGFVSDKIADALPMRPNARMASISFLDRVAFITNDGRVCVITGEDVDIISEPLLGADTSGSVQLHYYTDYERSWLIVFTPAETSDENEEALWYVYDWSRSIREKRDFWFPPWTSRHTALLFSPNFAANSPLFFAAVSDIAFGTKAAGITYMNPLTEAMQDDILDDGVYTTETIDFRARVGPLKLPPGNHANVHAIPAMTPAFHGVRADYYNGGADGEIGIGVYLDNTSSTVNLDLEMVDPTRREQSEGYTTKEGRMHEVTQDVALQITSGTIAPVQLLKIYRLTAMWFPEAGA